MGRAARPLHDTGSDRSIERGSDLSSCPPWPPEPPAKLAGERQDRRRSCTTAWDTTCHDRQQLAQTFLRAAIESDMAKAGPDFPKSLAEDSRGSLTNSPGSPPLSENSDNPSGEWNYKPMKPPGRAANSFRLSQPMNSKGYRSNLKCLKTTNRDHKIGLCVVCCHGNPNNHTSTAKLQMSYGRKLVTG